MDDNRPPMPDAFTLHQAQQAGLSKYEIYRRRDAGEFESIGRGLFRRTDAEPAQLDFIEIAARTPNATLCLHTALAHHNLIDGIPPMIDVALPRGTRTPRTSKLARWHHFDAATFNIERQLMPLTGDLAIGLYTAERSIIDAFRMRGSAGRELGIEALKNWLRRKGARPAHLVDLAKGFPRALTPLEAALEILL